MWGKSKIIREWCKNKRTEELVTKFSSSHSPDHNPIGINNETDEMMERFKYLLILDSDLSSEQHANDTQNTNASNKDRLPAAHLLLLHYRSIIQPILLSCFYTVLPASNGNKLTGITNSKAIARKVRFIIWPKAPSLLIVYTAPIWSLV